MSYLGQTDHRPWPLPGAPWTMTQTWHDLLFAHWPVLPEVLNPRIPQGLKLDLFKGQAWIGVVPFRMSGIKLRGILPVPTATQFPEINVRTYVVKDGKPGVFFFSLDAESRLAVAVARRLYHLPYHHARIHVASSGDWIEYHSQRPTSARFRARYRPTGDVRLAEPGTLEHWLTERYCLYTTGQHQTIHRGDIHHPPWPLQPAEAEIMANTLGEANGIALPDMPPLLHFARRLAVFVWPLVPATSPSP